MSEGIDAMTNDTADQWTFGMCPRCGQQGIVHDVGKLHFMVCDDDKVYWPIRSNLFSGGPAETEDQWQENERKLQEYKAVEPASGPPPDDSKRHAELRDPVQVWGIDGDSTELKVSHRRLMLETPTEELAEQMAILILNTTADPDEARFKLMEYAIEVARRHRERIDRGASKSEALSF